VSKITLTVVEKILKESGVTAKDILAEAGVTPEQAIVKLSSLLGVETATVSDGIPVEVSPSEVATLKAASQTLNRILSAA
jgi:hypothetical protein